MDLNGKHITVIGSEPDLRDRVKLISQCLNADNNNIRVEGVNTDDLSQANVGDFVIAPDSLKKGSISGLEGVVGFIWGRVSDQIPVVVIALCRVEDIQIPRVISITSNKDLPNALRLVLGV